MRGLVPCRSCAQGEPGLCTRTAEGEISAGMLTGFCHDLPGGWSTDMIVHRSQVFPVPDGIEFQKRGGYRTVQRGSSCGIAEPAPSGSEGPADREWHDWFAGHGGAEDAGPYL